MKSLEEKENNVKKCSGGNAEQEDEGRSFKEGVPVAFELSRVLSIRFVIKGMWRDIWQTYYTGKNLVSHTNSNFPPILVT